MLGARAPILELLNMLKSCRVDDPLPNNKLNKLSANSCVFFAVDLIGLLL